MFPPSPNSEFLRISIPDLSQLSPADPINSFAAGVRGATLVAACDPKTPSWWVRYAEWHYAQGDFARALESVSEVMRLAMPLGKVEDIANARAIQMVIYIDQDESVLAKQILDEIRVIGENPARKRGSVELNAIYLEAVGYYTLCTATLESGEFGEAERQLRRAADLFHRFGDTSSEIRALDRLARSQCGIGHYSWALETVERALERCNDANEWLHCGALLRTAATAFSDEGYHENVDDLFNLAIRWSEFVGDRLNKTMALYGLGVFRNHTAEEGNRDAIAELGAPLWTAAREYEALGMGTWWAKCHLALAFLNRKCGDSEADEFHQDLIHSAKRKSTANSDSRENGASVEIWKLNTESNALQLQRISRLAARLFEGLDNCPDPFVVFDPIYASDGRITDFKNELRNDAANQLIGVQSSSVDNARRIWRRFDFTWDSGSDAGAPCRVNLSTNKGSRG